MTKELSQVDLSSPDAANPMTTSEDTVSARLQRLEDAVVELCHTQPMEDRITEKVIGRIQHDPRIIKGITIQTIAEPAVDVARALPIATPAVPHAAEFHASTSMPAELPASNVAVYPLRDSLPLARSLLNRVVPPSSLFRDVWWDLRIAFRMLRDPLYPMTTACKVIPIVALLYVTVWPLFSSWTGIIGTIMNGLVYIAVLYVAYKVVSRELHRYYEFAVKYNRI